MLDDPLPPLLLMAAGLVLWLSTTIALGHGLAQVNGVALFTIGAAWLVVERVHAQSPSFVPVESRDSSPHAR